jgi:hypothetical protein
VTVGCHCVPGVGDGEDAGPEGYCLRGEIVRIAGAVEALVVPAHPGGLLGRQDLGGDVRAEARVPLDGLVFIGVERTLLPKDRVGRTAMMATLSEWSRVLWSFASTARARARRPFSACRRSACVARSSAESASTMSGEYVTHRSRPCAFAQ